MFDPTRVAAPEASELFRHEWGKGVLIIPDDVDDTNLFDVFFDAEIAKVEHLAGVPLILGHCEACDAVLEPLQAQALKIEERRRRQHLIDTCSPHDVETFEFRTLAGEIYKQSYCARCGKKM